MPGYDYILNPQRQSNPFTPTTKPVWLKKPADSGSREQSRMPAASEFGLDAKGGFSPSLLYFDNTPQSRRDVGASTAGKGPTTGFHSLMVPSSNTKLSHQSARDKSRSRAPSIPRKPAPLSSKSSPFPRPGAVHDMLSQKRQPVQSPISPASAQDTSTDPPRRQQTTDQRGIPSLSAPVATSVQAVDVMEPCESYVKDAPALPPRRQGSVGATKNLMDESVTRDDRMDSWKPLRPQ